MDNRPIAVFDSGFGGLSVWREIRRALPGESLVYFGDGKNCPYGPKPREEVIGYVDAAVRQLIDERGAKMLVVACNAATAAAIDFLRGRYPALPIVGMEPAVKPAVLTTKTGVVGILATAGTLSGRLFNRTAAQYADRARILTAVGEGFVEIVEAGKEDSPEALAAVEKVLAPMLDAGADRIVLGCTHYPFLEGAMRRVIGARAVELIDPAPAVARRVRSLLDEHGLRAEKGAEAVCDFLTAADEEYLRRLEKKADEITADRSS